MGSADEANKNKITGGEEGTKLVSKADLPVKESVVVGAGTIGIWTRLGG